MSLGRHHLGAQQPPIYPPLQLGLKYKTAGCHGSQPPAVCDVTDRNVPDERRWGGPGFVPLELQHETGAL